MKIKFRNPIIMGLIVCLTSSFLLRPDNKDLEANFLSTNIPSCLDYEIAPSGLPHLTSITAVKAQSVVDGSFIYFTHQPSGVYSHAPMSGTWFVSMQVTGSFGSFVDANYPTQCNNGMGSGPTWYFIYDAPITLECDGSSKIYFYSSTCP